MDQGRGAERGVGESGRTMGASIPRCHVAPRLLRGREDGRLEHDWILRVVVLRRDIGEQEGHGMRAGVAALDTRAIVSNAGVRMVEMNDGCVLVGRQAVVMFGVIMLHVSVHVLQRR
jgi:hypothetical protein